MTKLMMKGMLNEMRASQKLAQMGIAKEDRPAIMKKLEKYVEDLKAWEAAGGDNQGNGCP